MNESYLEVWCDLLRRVGRDGFVGSVGLCIEGFILASQDGVP